MNSFLSFRNNFLGKKIILFSTLFAVTILMSFALVPVHTVYASGGVPSATAVAAANASQTPPSGDCNLNPATWGTCMVSGAAGVVAAVALALASLMGFLLGFVGSLFNWIVVITVFQFGSYFGNSVGLLTAWGILRDIGNIVLLFAFIFMGIVMILDLHSVNARQAIPRLIIAAVVLNFSLFATEAVIDVANVLSASFYNQAGGAGCGNATNASVCANNGIAALVMNATGLNGIFTSGTDLGKTLQAIGGDPTHQMIVYIGMTIFISVTMVVLLAACIMLIIRGITLTFVMVLAPLGVVALVIPLFEKQGKQWRDALLSQSFFAPVYILLLLVSLKIMEAVRTSLLVGNPTATLLTALSAPNTSFGTIVIVFALVIGFMIAALMVAKEMGAYGADFATNVARKTVQSTATAPLRLGAFGAGVGYRMGVAPRFKAAGDFYNRKIGEARDKGGVTGFVAKTFDNAAGAAITGGLAKGRDLSIGGAQGYSDKQKADKAREESTSHAYEVAHYGDAIKKGSKQGATDADKDAMHIALQKLPPEDAGKIIRGMKEKSDRERATQALSTEKFKAILAKETSEQAKTAFANERYTIDPQATYDVMSEATKDFTADEWEIITSIKPELLRGALATKQTDKTKKNYGATAIKNSVATELLKKNSIGPALKSSIRDNLRPGQIKKIYKDNGAGALPPTKAVEVTLLAKNTSPKEFAELSNDDLARSELAEAWNVQKLKAVGAKDDGLDATQQRQVTESIQNYLNSVPRPGPGASQEDQAAYRAIQDNAAAMDKYLSSPNGRGIWGGNRINFQPGQPQQPPAPNNPPPPRRGGFRPGQFANNNRNP